MNTEQIKAEFEEYVETKSLDETFDSESYWTDVDELEACGAFRRGE